MKRLILLAMTALTLFSCSKSGDSTTPEPKPEPETPKSTILLTRVNDIVNGVSSVRIEYTYNGKQLTRASFGRLANGSFSYWQDFTYNAAGQLTGMVASSNTLTPTWKKADITWTNGNISRIVFTRSDNGATRENNFSYENGRLAIDRNSQSEIKYSYDASGRNIRSEFKELTGTGSGVWEFGAFDDKKSVFSAIPNWTYFLAYSYSTELFSDSYGANNPIGGSYKTSGYTYNSNESYSYSYTYNSFGYPATMEKKENSGSPSRYGYEYIEVK